MRSTRTRLSLTDVQFSVVALIDDIAVLSERVRYDAYGRARHRWFSDLDGDGDADGDDFFAFIAALGGGSTAIHADAAYRPDADIDRDGDVDSTDYFAYLGGASKAGLPLGLISDPTGPDNPIGYDGYVFAPEAGLVVGEGGGQPQAVGAYCVRFRWYVPEIGRWLQRDPAGYVDGMGLFEISRGRTTVLVDPDGLRSGPPKWAFEWLEHNTWIGTRLLVVGGAAAAAANDYYWKRQLESRGARSLTAAEQNEIMNAISFYDICGDLPFDDLGAPDEVARAYKLMSEGVVMAGDSMEEMGYTLGSIEGFFLPQENFVLIDADVLASALAEHSSRTGSAFGSYEARIQLAITIMHESLHWETGFGEENAYALENYMFSRLLLAVELRLAQMENNPGSSCESVNACLGSMSQSELEKLRDDLRAMRNESNQIGAESGFNP